MEFSAQCIPSITIDYPESNLYCLYTMRTMMFRWCRDQIIQQRKAIDERISTHIFSKLTLSTTYFGMPMLLSKSTFVITCFSRIYLRHKKFCERVTSDKSIVKLKKSLETIHKIVLNGNVTDMGFQIWDNFKFLSF